MHVSHLNDKKHANKYLQRAWLSHGPTSFAFEIIEMIAQSQNQYEREQFYIDKFHACDRDIGYNLNPVAGKFTHTEETRKKVAEANRLRIVSTETRAKMSEYAKNNRSPEHIEKTTRALRNKSQEHLAKLGAAHKGKVISEEQRAKQSASTKGREHTPEHCSAISSALTGKKLTLEHCAAIRLAKSNISEETRRKIATAKKGQKHSEISKLKISLALRGKKYLIRKKTTRNLDEPALESYRVGT